MCMCPAFLIRHPSPLNSPPPHPLGPQPYWNMSAPISADDRLIDYENGGIEYNHFPVVAVRSGMDLEIYKVSRK